MSVFIIVKGSERKVEEPDESQRVTFSVNFFHYTYQYLVLDEIKERTETKSTLNMKITKSQKIAE